MMKMRPATAGLNTLVPMPPKSILATTIANAVPRAAMSGGQVAGSVNARSIAVITQDRSPAVDSRRIAMQQRCSHRSAVAMQTRTTSGAPRP